MSIPSFIWLIGIPLITTPLIYLTGRILRQTANEKICFARYFALLVMLGLWVPFVMTVNDFLAGTDLVFTYGKVSLEMDGLALLLSGVSLGLGTMVMIYSGPYMAGENNEGKYYAMLTLMVGVMMGLGTATDLFNLWIWFETMAVSSCLLVAFYRENPKALEAGVKYLIQSASGSMLVLVGISFVFMETGTMSLAEISAAGSSPLLIGAGALLMLGFGVKAALVPVHTWLPDAHSQAPSGISAMLSGVVIEAGLIALLKSLGALAHITDLWGPIFMGFGALNMLVGNLMALRQKEVKRLLAFSSLSHIGYIMVGLGAGVMGSLQAGFQGSMFHVITHALMKGTAFLAVGTLLLQLHHDRNADHDALVLDDLNGAWTKYPVIAFTLSVALLALGGLPPLAGFMSKWQIFVAGFQTGNGWVIALVIFAAINSVLSLGYYAPIVNRIYRKESSALVSNGHRIAPLMVLPLAIMTLLIIILGIWPDLISSITIPAGESLLGLFGG